MMYENAKGFVHDGDNILIVGMDSIPYKGKKITPKLVIVENKELFHIVYQTHENYGYEWGMTTKIPSTVIMDTRKHVRLQVEPGSVIDTLLKEYGKNHIPSLEELCKAPTQKQKTIFQHFGVEYPLDEDEDAYY